jgi:hypothetical protein
MPLVMTTYNLASTFANVSMPKSFCIVGSTNGTTWSPIHYASTTTTSTLYTNGAYLGAFNVNSSVAQNGYTTTTSYASSTNSYTYFRLIVISTFNSPTTNPYTLIGQWLINFTPASSSSVSMTLDNAAPNQLNIGGALGIAGGITPLYSTPSLGPGQVGQVLQGIIPATWPGSTNLAGIAITPGVWLVTFFIYCTNGASNFFCPSPTGLAYPTSSVVSFGSTYPCSGTYIYTAPSSTTIYLYSYTNGVTCSTGNSYHTAVRIA